MKEVQAENDLSFMLSTYGLITAERILERYNIRLKQDELMRALKQPNSFYHRVLRVPMKNVLNGIILQQAHDYQVYAQKLFIDYLMSGETNRSEDSPGAVTREDLETKRMLLVEMAEEFRECELDHHRLIAESQKSYIQYAKEWQQFLVVAVSRIQVHYKTLNIKQEGDSITKILKALLIELDVPAGAELSIKNETWSNLEKTLEQQFPAETKKVFVDELGKLLGFFHNFETESVAFNNQVMAMGTRLGNWRTDFYKLILQVIELMNLLPDYKYNQAQNEENRESLHFDPEIGKEK